MCTHAHACMHECVRPFYTILRELSTYSAGSYLGSSPVSTPTQHDTVQCRKKQPPFRCHSIRTQTPFCLSCFFLVYQIPLFTTSWVRGAEAKGGSFIKHYSNVNNNTKPWVQRHLIKENDKTKCSKVNSHKVIWIKKLHLFSYLLSNLLWCPLAPPGGSPL